MVILNVDGDWSDPIEEVGIKLQVMGTIPMSYILVQIINIYYWPHHAD